MSQSRISAKTLATAQDLLNKLGGMRPLAGVQQSVVSNSSHPSNQTSHSNSSSSVSSTGSQSSTASTTSHTLESKEVSGSPNIAINDLVVIDYLKSQSAEILNAAYFLAMTANPKPQDHAQICALLKMANAYHFQAEARFKLPPGKMQDEIEGLVKTYQALDQTLLRNEDLLKPIAASAKVTRNKNINKQPTRAGRGVAPVLLTPKAVIQTNEVPYLDDRSLAAFARSSLYASQLTQTQREQRAIKKLFNHIVEGEMAEVEKMLKTNPHLASIAWRGEEAKEEKTVIRNKAGQRILAQGKTAYQLALGEEDTQMAKFIKDRIVEVASEEEADRQFRAQFPEGWEEAEEKAWKPLFTQLTALNDAIRDSVVGDIVSSGYPEYKLTLRAGSAVGQALNRFTSLLDAKREEIATTGRHFNPKLLLQGFQEYEDREDQFGDDWSDPRALLSWQRGIGSIEKRLMPANYWQAFSGGIYDTTENLKKNAPQGREFTFDIWNPAENNWRRVPFSYFSALVGVDIGIYGVGSGRGASDFEPFAETVDNFKPYVEQKQKAWGLMRPRPQHRATAGWCLIQ